MLEGEEKKIYDEYLFNETEFRKIPAEGQAAFKAMEKYVASFSFSNFGGLQTVSDELLSESNLDILPGSEKSLILPIPVSMIC